MFSRSQCTEKLEFLKIHILTSGSRSERVKLVYLGQNILFTEESSYVHKYIPNEAGIIFSLSGTTEVFLSLHRQQGYAWSGNSALSQLGRRVVEFGGTSGDHLVYPLAQNRTSQSSLCWATSSQALNSSHDGDSLASLSNLSSSLCLSGIPCVSGCASCLLYCHWPLLRSLAQPSLFSPIRNL